MKHPILFALIFGFTAFSASARNDVVIVREEIGYILADSANTRTATEARALAPVAARISRQQLATARPTYSGILPRIAAARHPAEMISPFAPRSYGAGWNLVTITNRDPYRTVTPSNYAPQPTALRVLGINGIW